MTRPRSALRRPRRTKFAGLGLTDRCVATRLDFESLQGRAVAAAGSADLGALTGQLKDIQFDAERQFARLTASLVEAQEQLTRRADGR